MNPAEQTAEMPMLRRSRPTVVLLTAVALVPVIAAGIALTLRDGGGGRVDIGALQTTGPTVVPPTAPATTAPPPADGRGAATESTTLTTAPSTTSPPPSTTTVERLGPTSRLSLDGVGPVRIGMTLREAAAAAGVPLRLLDMPPGPECRYAVPDPSSGTGDELGFMVVDGRIARVDVGIMGPDRIRTVSGIGKGNTEAEVQAAYPGRIRVEPHPYAPNGRNLVYVPADPRLADRRMIFEAVDGRVHAFRAGLAAQVGWPEGCS